MRSRGPFYESVTDGRAKTHLKRGFSSHLKRDASWDIPWQELGEKEKEGTNDEEDEPNLGPALHAHDPGPDEDRKLTPDCYVVKTPVFFLSD